LAEEDERINNMQQIGVQSEPSMNILRAQVDESYERYKSSIKSREQS
jgi:hypothetical protein